MKKKLFTFCLNNFPICGLKWLGSNNVLKRNSVCNNKSEVLNTVSLRHLLSFLSQLGTLCSKCLGASPRHWAEDWACQLIWSRDQIRTLVSSLQRPGTVCYLLPVRSDIINSKIRHIEITRRQFDRRDLTGMKVDIKTVCVFIVSA